jgi:hypothetical protein
MIAYKLLQMLSGFYVVGFGLLFPISFWIVTLHYHHRFTIWKEAFSMIELSLMPFGKKIVNA